VRFATPSPQWTCTTYSLPVSRRTVTVILFTFSSSIEVLSDAFEHIGICCCRASSALAKNGRVGCGARHDAFQRNGGRRGSRSKLLGLASGFVAGNRR